MTPKRPIELIKASQACAEAWARRDAMIEAFDIVGVKAMNTTCNLLDEHYRTLYRQWQILGGTSDVESLTFPAGLPVSCNEPPEPAASYGGLDLTPDQLADDYADLRRTQEDARY